MSYSESDRIAHLAHIAKLERELKIAAWLKANPEVGVLNNPKGGHIYYVMVAGEQAVVIAPCDLKADASAGLMTAMAISGFNQVRWSDDGKALAVFTEWFRAGLSPKQALIFAE